MRVSLLLLGAAALFQRSYTSVSGQHITCTNGRVFLADEQQPMLHALDADDGEVYDADVSASAPHVWLSSTGTVVSSASTGVTQFLHTGILLEDHQDHKDVHKEFPFVYDYSVSGVGGSIASRRITESHGYIGVHYGSSATFVKNDDFQFTPNVNPHTISLSIAQPASQGIALALSETRFLVSVANGFTVLDQTGSSTQNVIECANYGGSGFSDNEYIHLCGNDLLLMHDSNSVLESTLIQDTHITHITEKAVNQQFIGYQPTTNTLIRFRVDTVTRNNLLDTANVYTYPITDTSIHGLNPCTIEYEQSDHHHVIVFWPTGRMDVLDADSSSSLGLDKSIQVIPGNGSVQQQACDALSFSVGADVVYIAHKSSQTLYKVDLHDSDIQSKSLTFVPGSMAFFYDRQVLCEEGGHHDDDHDHDHDHTPTTTTPTEGHHDDDHNHTPTPTPTPSASATTSTLTGPSSEPTGLNSCTCTCPTASSGH